MRTFDIVLTTIFEPSWLDGYLENIERHGHAEAVTLRIIADRRTPSSVFAAAEAASARGFAVDCPDLDEQESFLRRIGLPAEFIPWNSDNRRNVGYLRAWEAGSDVLISIDDDNYCRPDSDYIGCHGTVGSSTGSDGSELVSGKPWFNLCELLDGATDATIYPRGFPYGARVYSAPGAHHEVSIAPVQHEAASRTVAVNAGLWLEDPDVDAVTRLALRPHCDRAQARDVVLAPGTWSPINTQNTALVRDGIPAYYYVRMGFPVKGMLIDRFGDIWSGYFLQRCTEQLGQVVRIGSPVADHRRSSHNLFKDLYQELAGIVLTEELLPWLRELPMTASSYSEAYEELAEALSEQAPRFSGFLWDEGGREFLSQTAENMRTWLRAVRQLAGG